MEVICLEERAFYALIDKLIAHIDQKHDRKQEKWISTEEAMKRLQITSKTTLQKYRDEGEIRFSQPRVKPIAYDADSIDEFWERYAKETF